MLSVANGHVQHAKCGEKMANALAYEKADELGNPIKHLTIIKGNISAIAHPWKPCQAAQAKSAKRPCIDTAVDVLTNIHVLSLDENDVNYLSILCSESYNFDDTTDMWWLNEVASKVLLSNDEVFF